MYMLGVRLCVCFAFVYLRSCVACVSCVQKCVCVCLKMEII